MHKYLFITYGQSGWRGVQIRALRMAKYLPKEEVMFWEMYDSEFIKSWGFTVENKDPGITDPADIEFPTGTEVVVFSDLPSNEFFEYSVFIATRKKGLKTVICDQFYKRNQFEKGIFKKFLDLSDLFLTNTISYFKDLESEKLKVIPPQVEMEFTPQTRKEMCQKYGVPENSVILFGSGYNPEIFEKIKTLSLKLGEKNNRFFTILIGPSEIKSLQKEKQLLILPFNIGDDYFRLMYSSDIMLVKFGFLQILECVALHKPTIVLGEAGYVLKYRDIVDEVFKKALRFDLEITEDTYSYIEKLITDESFRQNSIESLKKLHDGELFGARKGAEEIKKLLTRSKEPQVNPSKKIAILMNNEIIEKDYWLKENDDIYPLCIIISLPTQPEVVKRIPPEILEKKIKELQYYREDEPLPHSYKNLHVFSIRKLDGFMDIFPWYEEWISQLSQLLEKSDTIYISEQGKKIFNSYLIKKGLQNKVKSL